MPGWIHSVGGTTCDAEVPADCTRPHPPEPTPAADGADVPSITLRDLAAFSPATPVVAGEPNGLAILGTATNFVADTATQLVPGRLLDRPAEVRFTPVAYHWDFGDGGTAQTSTPGASWSSLGQAGFSDTATSHRYRDKGTFTMTLTVAFAAEYRFDGGPFTPTEGYVQVAAAPYPVRVLELDTRLVRGDCIAYPDDPGC